MRQLIPNASRLAREITPQLDAIAIVDQILQVAIDRKASDVHIEPTATGAQVRLRIDGLLEVHATHDPAVGRSLVTRLMVMAHLLTYRLDVPQEGRVRIDLAGGSALDLRLAVMPTTHGLRAAVRMPAEFIQTRRLDELGLPDNVLTGLRRFATADAGMLLIIGPAGSGKTTTIYALLEQIVATQPGLSIVTLEDPVERDIPGVTQIEISPFGQLTYERALRSMLRQDPQVLVLGEIRDSETASLATQAALSGHRLVCTLHASMPGGAIARMLEMGLEPFRVTSSLFGVVAQRLLRRTTPQGGYSGRVPAAEFVPMTSELRRAVLTRADAAQLQQLAIDRQGYRSLRQSADDLVAQHITDAPEVQRVLGCGSES